MLIYNLQNKGKESENSYQELKRSQKERHTQSHGNCIEIFRLARPSFSIRKRVNVCEHTTKMASLESLRKVPPGVVRGMDGEKLSEIEKDARASRNISIQFPRVCVCLSFCDLFNSW